MAPVATSAQATTGDWARCSFACLLVVVTVVVQNYVLTLLIIVSLHLPSYNRVGMGHRIPRHCHEPLACTRCFRGHILHVSTYQVQQYVLYRRFDETYSIRVHGSCCVGPGAVASTTASRWGRFRWVGLDYPL